MNARVSELREQINLLAQAGHRILERRDVDQEDKARLNAAITRECQGILEELMEIDPGGVSDEGVPWKKLYELGAELLEKIAVLEMIEGQTKERAQ